MTDTDNLQERDIERQITVVDITYGKEFARFSGKYRERPEITTLDIPESIMKLMDEDEDRFNDSVEQFAYNTLTRKYGAEVSHCQVWLPPR